MMFSTIRMLLIAALVVSNIQFSSGQEEEEKFLKQILHKDHVASFDFGFYSGLDWKEYLVSNIQKNKNFADKKKLKRKVKFGKSYIDFVYKDKYAVEFIVEINSDKKEVFMKGHTKSKGKHYTVDAALESSNDKLQKTEKKKFAKSYKWSVIIIKTAEQALKLQEAAKKIDKDKDFIARGGSCWYGYSNAGYMAVLHRAWNTGEKVSKESKPIKKKKSNRKKSNDENKKSEAKKKKKKKKKGSSSNTMDEYCKKSSKTIQSTLSTYAKQASKDKKPKECKNNKSKFGGTSSTAAEQDFLDIMKSEAEGFKDILTQMKELDKVIFLENAQILMSKAVQCHTQNFSYDKPIMKKNLDAFLQKKYAILLSTTSGFSGSEFGSGLRDLEQKLSHVRPEENGVGRWIVTIMELNDVNCGSVTYAADEGRENCSKKWNSSPQYVGKTGFGTGGVVPNLFSGAENWVVADKESNVLISLVCLKKRNDNTSCNFPGQKKRKTVKSNASFSQADIDTIKTELYEKPAPNKLVLVQAVARVLSLKQKKVEEFMYEYFDPFETGDGFYIKVPKMTEEEELQDSIDRFLHQGYYYTKDGGEYDELFLKKGITEQLYENKDKAIAAFRFGADLLKAGKRKFEKKVLGRKVEDPEAKKGKRIDGTREGA